LESYILPSLNISNGDKFILFAQQGHLRKPGGGLRRFTHGLRRFMHRCVNRKKVYARFTQVYAGLRSLRAGQLADVTISLSMIV
jgi:hypothetical protein